MKYIKWLITAVVVVGLLIFTAIFVINAYNKGKIGNKDEKTAADFVEDIQGVWQNTSSGTIASQITDVSFQEDGNVTVVILGQTAEGTYTDEYDLKTEKHSLTVKGKIYGSVSVERTFDAVLSDDKDTLSLKDTESSLEFVLVRTDEEQLTTKKQITIVSEKTTVGETEETTAAAYTSVEEYAQALLGKWTSKLSSASSYEFTDSSNVKISLIGFTADGTYSLAINSDGQCEIKINYANLSGVTVSNTYIVVLTDNELKLVQKNAESVSVTYVKER